MKVVQLENRVSNFDALISPDFWAEFGGFTAYDRTAPAELAERAADADALLTNKTVFDAAQLRRLPKLRYIGVLATGYNVIDLAACAAAGVAVTNVPAYSTESVAQLVFAHLLNWARGVEFHARSNWSDSPDFSRVLTPQRELNALTIGLIGFGAIARRVAVIAQAFGMKVVTRTRTPSKVDLPGVRAVELNELLEKCDVISLHCPLTAENTRMLDAAAFARMKPGAYLINTARGGLIDEAALLAALNSGRLSGAGLDVLTEEPPSPANALLNQPECRLTPHIAWTTREARLRLFDTARENLRAFAAGKKLNRIV